MGLSQLISLNLSPVVMSGPFFPARSAPAVGLGNVGNSCYINSVVQSLYLTDTFRSRILSLRLTPAEMKQFGTLRALQHTFAMLSYCTRDHYIPRAFACEMPARFNSGQQQDADEYAKYLLDMVSASVAQLSKQRQAATKRKVEDIAVEPSQREEKRRDSPKHESAEVGEAEDHGKIRGGAQPLTHSASSAHTKPIIPTASAQRYNNTAIVADPSFLSPSQPSVSASPFAASASAPLPFTPPPPSPLDVDPFFGGLSSSCIACLRCGSVSRKDEAFLELPLPMQQMDDEQRGALTERIERTREAAQSGQTVESDEKEDAVMPQQPQNDHSSIEAESANPSPASSLPLAVLAKIAAFSKPLQTTSKALRPASSSLSASTFSSPSTLSTPSTSTMRSATPAAAAPGGGGSSRELPLDVLARIAEFASVRPKMQTSTSTTPQQPAGALTTTKPTHSASSTSSAASFTSSTYGAMQDSSAPAIVSQSSASVSLPASSSQPPSPAHALLAAFLAQSVWQAQAAAITAIATVAAAAQKVSEEQAVGTQKGQKEPVSLMDVDEDSSRTKQQEEECTALVVYAPPPHKPLSPSDAARSPSDCLLASPSTALILAPPHSSLDSSSSSAASSPSLLQLSAMLALYLAPELLTGENAYHCSRCQSKQPATKTLTVTQPPPHLMLCLKRNAYDKSTHSRHKIATEVKFPALLALPTGAAQSTAVYCLYSVVVHGGASADSGHYTAIGRWSGELRRRMRAELQRLAGDGTAHAGDWARYESELEGAARSGEWWLMNDASVTSASFATIAQLTKRCATDVAYLLLYVRVDDDDEAGADGNGEAEVLTVNPLLERLAVMEQQMWVRAQEKSAQQALASVMQRLPKLPDYKPPPADYVDPDM